jgi:hypothetical protein
MSETVSLGVRVTPELAGRIRRLAEQKADGIQATKSQVLRAALELGLRILETSESGKKLL